MSSVELLSSYEKAKKDLKSIDESIKRVTGRDPNESKAYKRSLPVTSNEDRAENPKQINLVTPDFDSSNHGILSQVNVLPKRTRQEAVKSTLDATDKARGRRMFGLLQGTLNAAKKESENKSLIIQEEKRKEIDERLEKEHKIEKEKFDKERTELFDNRRKHRIEIFILEDRLFKTREFEQWKQSMLDKIGFICTRNSPKIFFKPASETAESKSRAKETEAEIELLIKTREQELNQELDESERFRRSRLNDHSQERPQKTSVQAPVEIDDDIDALMMPSMVSVVNKSYQEDQSSDGSLSDTSPKRTVRRVVANDDDDTPADTRRVINL